MKSLLIANRGEIARRIIRTARRMGIRTVAVYSEADAGMPFVSDADAAVAIGPAAARESYLSADKILAAARSSGADAIHPGYGFLSENAEFAEAVTAAGLIWVGAPPAAIRAMGLKDAAKALMQQSGVPVTPGYLGADQNIKTLHTEADRIGYPILIKAVAGGGGKGMRRVEESASFEDALASCRREAAAAFGDDRVLLEKYILSPRHIEVQVFGDTHGDIVHLFERDCSVQRRHQKVIEEAPAPGMNAETRAVICDIAVKAARAVKYVGAGTIEFIADASEGLRADRIWFMEMNTRLQVEHPVTEAITGQDLVEWQLRVADGERLPRSQGELAIKGCAIEARLYAENPATGFLPSTGSLRRLRFPTGLRIDSGVVEGGEITNYYDPMIAKLIAYGRDRETAVHLLSDACRKLQVWPVHTNAAFLATLTEHPEFLAARLDTGFIQRNAESLIPNPIPPARIIDGAAAALLGANAADPWSALHGFRANAAAYTRVELLINDTPQFSLRPKADASCDVVTIDGNTVLFDAGMAWSVKPATAVGVVASARAGDGTLRSPMPGRIVTVTAAAGQKVLKGQPVLSLEAMKMEHTLTAPFDGTVVEVAVKVGDQVAEGVALARIERDGAKT